MKSRHSTARMTGAAQSGSSHFRFLSARDAMNIEGLSEATLEKLIARGFIHSFADIYHLDRYRAEIVEMEGFGEKSYANLMDSIEKSRTTLLSRVVYALGIPNIGVANAKLLCRFFDYDFAKLREAGEEEIASVEGDRPDHCSVGGWLFCRCSQCVGSGRAACRVDNRAAAGEPAGQDIHRKDICDHRERGAFCKSQ